MKTKFWCVSIGLIMLSLILWFCPDCIVYLRETGSTGTGKRRPGRSVFLWDVFSGASNKWKSQGDRSGLKGGCWRCSRLNLASTHCVSLKTSECTLSWSKINPSVSSPGRLLLMDICLGYTICLAIHVPFNVLFLCWRKSKSIGARSLNWRTQ